MREVDRSAVIRLSEIQAGMPDSSKVFHRGTLDLKLNILLPPNKLASHAQDEIYIVLDGRGVFVHNGQRDAFGPGDFLFVGAGVEHIFEEFEKLTLWRIYYGVDGGELPVQAAAAVGAA